MPNLERKINNHNKSILRKHPQQSERMCNYCRSRPDCPLKGECLSNNLPSHCENQRYRPQLHDTGFVSERHHILLLLGEFGI